MRTQSLAGAVDHPLLEIEDRFVRFRDSLSLDDGCSSSAHEQENG